VVLICNESIAGSEALDQEDSQVPPKFIELCETVEAPAVALAGEPCDGFLSGSLRISSAGLAASFHPITI
jgi:hypothetical protein